MIDDLAVYMFMCIVTPFTVHSTSSCCNNNAYSSTLGDGEQCNMAKYTVEPL